MSIILTALIAGAAAGSKGVAAEGVKDAYTALKARAAKYFADKPAARAALDQLEEDREIAASAADGADSSQVVLHDAIIESGLDMDSAAIAEARALGELLGLKSFGERRSQRIRIQGSQGVQVGDGNFQRNTFNA